MKIKKRNLAGMALLGSLLSSVSEADRTEVQLIVKSGAIADAGTTDGGDGGIDAGTNEPVTDKTDENAGAQAIADAGTTDGGDGGIDAGTNEPVTEEAEEEPSTSDLLYWCTGISLSGSYNSHENRLTSNPVTKQGGGSEITAYFAWKYRSHLLGVLADGVYQGNIITKSGGTKGRSDSGYFSPKFMYLFNSEDTLGLKASIGADMLWRENRTNIQGTDSRSNGKDSYYALTSGLKFSMPGLSPVFGYYRLGFEVNGDLKIGKLLKGNADYGLLVSGNIGGGLLFLLGDVELSLLAHYLAIPNLIPTGEPEISSNGGVNLGSDRGRNYNGAVLEAGLDYKINEETVLSLTGLAPLTPNELLHAGGRVTLNFGNFSLSANGSTTKTKEGIEKKFILGIGYNGPYTPEVLTHNDKLLEYRP